MHLTRLEYQLLVHLCTHPDRVLTHQQILKAVWGPNHTADTHYLRVFMAGLRKKIEDDPTRPRHLLTEIGVGVPLCSLAFHRRCFYTAWARGGHSSGRPAPLTRLRDGPVFKAEVSIEAPSKTRTLCARARQIWLPNICMRRFMRAIRAREADARQPLGSMVIELRLHLMLVYEAVWALRRLPASAGSQNDERANDAPSKWGNRWGNK